MSKEEFNPNPFAAGLEEIRNAWGSGFLFRCGRTFSSDRGWSGEVPTLGLVRIFRDRFSRARSHAARANAAFKHLVHRFRDRR